MMLKNSMPAADSVEMPFQVQKDVLDALFGRSAIIWQGFIAHAVGTVTCYQLTGDRAFLFFPIMLGVVALYRYYIHMMWEGRKADVVSLRELKDWEWHCVFGALGTGFSLGILCAYGVFSHWNTLAGTVSVSLALASMPSVVGRNFASLRTAKALTYGLCGPLALALAGGSIWYSNVYLAILALPVAILMATSMGLSRYLNQHLMKTIVDNRARDIVVRRFDIAIESMPNGLILVDGDFNISVLSANAASKLEIAHDTGGSVVRALEEVMRPEDIASVVNLLKGGRGDDGTPSVTVRTKDARRWLKVTVRPIGETSDIIFDEADGWRHEGAAVVIVENVTDSMRKSERLTHMASFDKLTQLANRQFWEEETEKYVSASREGSPETLVALAVLDIDRFKLINDTLGHLAGDRVLEGVASRLAAFSDERIFCGRLGGDEFVVLVRGVTGEAEAKSIFDDLFASLSGLYQIEDKTVEVRCSGGVIVKKAGMFDLQSDMARADMALYKVKRDTEKRWWLFDAKMDAAFVTNARIKNDLRAAIKRGNLQVVYQPIYDATGERVLSSEALCRWEHHEVGFISPPEFIAMAEEIGLIGKLTEYVLRTACRDCVSWSSDVGVSVNLSAMDLSRDDILPMIRKALGDFGMSPTKLCVEVTETVFVKDYRKTASTLQTLQEMGVKTSLDDFGTGYSSLSYMSRLPLDRVKIDRSFVVNVIEDPKARRLFKGVVSLAKELEFEVIVEGVEKEDQLGYIQSVPGVDMIQGHIFSRGMCTAEMAQLMRNVEARGLETVAGE